MVSVEGHRKEREKGFRPAQVTESAPSPQKTRAENMTKVQKISRALRSGAIKSELRTAQDAIWMAKALDQQIKAAGLGDNDRHVYIAYMTPDLAVLSTLPFVEGREQEILKLLTGPGTCSIMVGLVYAMRDDEHGGDWLFAHKPFLATPNVVAALDQRAEAGPGLEGIN
jgi:hypothetical protein